MQLTEGGSGNRARDLLPETEPMAIQDIRDALIIRERDLFLLTDRAGEAPRSSINGYGLYTPTLVTSLPTNSRSRQPGR